MAKSLQDTLPPFQKKMQLEDATSNGNGWKVSPISAEALNVKAIDRAWVNRQCTPQPLATLQQTIKLNGNANAIKNVTYIMATAFNDSPFSQFYDEAKAKGWKTLTLACGHDVMLDLPEKLAQVLAEVRANDCSRTRTEMRIENV